MLFSRSRVSQRRQQPAMQVLAAVAVVTAAVVAVTWPQARDIATHVVGHQDPYFSMWRISWIAHAISNTSVSLFDANIFHPAARTLAMSDATMLEGVLAAPLLWAGISVVTVYNLLLLGGMVGSGLGMFLLARRLVGAAGPAVVAAVIFAAAPYRIEHVMHLELQWAMWIPLTLWAIHRALDEDSWRFGLLAGVFIWLQVLSSIYYGVFLVMMVAVALPLLVMTQSKHALAGLAAGAVIATLLTIPYAIPYRENAAALGPRPLWEVGTYSARLESYIASPPTNHWWGWTSRWGGAELSLFPGLMASLLAAAAVLHRPRRLPLVYFVLTIVAVEMSLGTNGWLYAWVLGAVDALRGLRAPARFGIVSLCGIAILAAFGLRAIQRRMRPAWGAIAVLASLTILVLEYRTTMTIAPVAPQPPEQTNVYVAIRRLGPGVLMEWPVPSLNRLPGFDWMYAFWSREHWHPIVNGYSGYYPVEFAELVVNTYNFPNERSLEYLRARGVRYITVHHVHLDGQDLDRLLDSMRASLGLQYVGKFTAPSGWAELFIVRPAE